MEKQTEIESNQCGGKFDRKSMNSTNRPKSEKKTNKQKEIQLVKMLGESLNEINPKKVTTNFTHFWFTRFDVNFYVMFIIMVLFSSYKS